MASALAPHLGRLALPLALALAALALLFAAGPGASAAEAASPCQRWGDRLPSRLDASQARKAIKCLLNKQRQRYGLRKFDRDRRLNRASQRHSRYMRRHGCFSHQCPGEASLEGRLRRADYLKSGLSRWSYGENIAWGGRSAGTPREMVDAWMQSPGHRANILNPTFRDLGVGFVTGSPYKRSANAGIYTTDFGLRVG